jgi:hypothetical protein
MKFPAALLALASLGLTPAQQRGLHIYLHGTSPSGRAITATVGAGGTPFPAAIVPCVNCHGEEGRGRIEANVRPADITPDSLGRAATVNGRPRPAYTRSHLKRAIGMGIDSGRNPLSAAMPRYALTQDDATDLLEFLAILGTQAPPGITDDFIRIGVVGDAGLSAPDTPLYGRRLALIHDASPDVFVRINASSATFADGVPTIDVPSLTSSVDEQREALRNYARRIGAEPVFATGCDLPREPLILMTSDVAAQCDMSMFPRDRHLIVAAAHPPTEAVLALLTKLLAELGRDVTRGTLDAALRPRLHQVWLMGAEPG